MEAVVNFAIVTKNFFGGEGELMGKNCIFQGPLILSNMFIYCVIIYVDK
jgi:hypothetical protein